MNLEPLLEDPKELTACNPKIVEFLKKTTSQSLEENPDFNFAVTLYLTIKSFTQVQKIILVRSDHVADFIFGYYLETYKELRRDLYADDRLEIDLYNEATLSLFDLIDPFEKRSEVRRLITRAAEAIHTFMSSKVSLMENVNPQVMVSYLTDLAMFTSTTSYYLSVSRYKHNVPYIKWLRSFLNQVLNDEDLSLLHDEHVKNILEQIKFCRKRITV